MNLQAMSLTLRESVVIICESEMLFKVASRNVNMGFFSNLQEPPKLVQGAFHSHEICKLHVVDFKSVPV